MTEEMDSLASIPVDVKNVETKGVFQQLNELLQHHKLKRQFNLLNETKDANGQASFEVQLEMGDETFSGNGSSLKAAQLMAATAALNETKLELPKCMNNSLADSEKVPLQNASFDRHSNDHGAYKYFESKLNEIQPSSKQCNEIYSLIVSIERNLKRVSDEMTSDAKQAGTTVCSKTLATHMTFDGHCRPDDEYRILKGVMRVGNLAKDLLLKTDVNIELVLLCAQKPTKQLLMEACTKLQELLTDYCLAADETNACIRVEHNIYQVKIFLSSILFRPENFDVSVSVDDLLSEEPEDMLPIKVCLYALREVRQAKWFQMHFAHRSNATKILKIIRSMSEQKPWSLLPQYAYELLIDHCAASGIDNPPMIWILRKFLEILSSGLLYKNSLGVLDPCEKEVTNVIGDVSSEDIDEVVCEAQRMLRLLVFKKVHEIFGLPKEMDSS